MAKGKLKHQWKRESNSNFKLKCTRCGVKREMKRVPSKMGRFGFRMEIIFHQPDGTKHVVDKHHNFTSPGCQPSV